MQGEHVLAGEQHRAVDDRFGDQRIEHRAAVIERAHERLLFVAQRVLHVVQAAGQFRIARLERRDDRAGQLRHELARIAEQTALANRAADQEAQHVAAIGVRRIDAVGDQERHGARVVGDDVAARQLFVRRERGRADAGLRGDQIGEEIGLVHRRFAVDEREDALEAHAGVDRLARQIAQHAVGAAIILLKHDVPELDEPVALVRSVVIGTRRVRRTVVVEDLGARTARTGRAHRPEVVVVVARDARGREADLALPDVLRFVVGGVNGDVELVFVELPNVRREVPCEADRLALVVVAEREVAEHLEERAVASGAADVLDVALGPGHAQAALDGDRARRRRRLLAEKHRDELLHAGDREQRRAHRIGNQRRGRQMRMPLAYEIVDEARAKFLRPHNQPTVFATPGPSS